MWGEKGKNHQSVFKSITSSPTAVQVCASEAKASTVPPLFPVMRETDCLCQHFLVFFFFLVLVTEGHCVEKQVTCAGLREMVLL